MSFMTCLVLVKVQPEKRGLVAILLDVLMPLMPFFLKAFLQSCPSSLCLPPLQPLPPPTCLLSSLSPLKPFSLPAFLPSRLPPLPPSSPSASPSSRHLPPQASSFPLKPPPFAAERHLTPWHPQPVWLRTPISGGTTQHMCVKETSHSGVPVPHDKCHALGTTYSTCNWCRQAG